GPRWPWAAGGPGRMRSAGAIARWAAASLAEPATEPRFYTRRSDLRRDVVGDLDREQQLHAKDRQSCADRRAAVPRYQEPTSRTRRFRDNRRLRERTARVRSARRRGRRTPGIPTTRLHGRSGTRR